MFSGGGAQLDAVGIRTTYSKSRAALANRSRAFAIANVKDRRQLLVCAPFFSPPPPPFSFVLLLVIVRTITGTISVLL